MRRAILRARRSYVRPSSLAPHRGLVTPSEPRYGALAQLKDQDIDEIFDYYAPQSSSHSSRRPRRFIVLEPPTPSDTPQSRTQSALYPTTSHLDSLVMISVCLKRPASIPRGYSIFQALISAYEAKTGACPDGRVWGEVIAAVIGNCEKIEDGGSMRWVSKGRELVELWEEFKGGEIGIGRAVLVDGGEKVYQGLLRGCIDAGISTSPIFRYLHAHSPLTLTQLMAGFQPREVPKICDKLIQDARHLGHTDIVSMVEDARKQQTGGEEQAETVPQGSALVDEVAAIEIRQVEKMKISRTIQEMENAADQKGPASPGEADLRFQITNLRQALAPIAETSLLPAERQRALELASLQAAHAELQYSAEELAKSSTSGVAAASIMSQRKLQAWMWEWLGKLTEKLEAKIAEMEERGRKARERAAKASSFKAVSKIPTMTTANAKEADLLLYMNLLTPRKLALITILETMRLCGQAGQPEGVKVLRNALAIGKGIESEYRIESIKEVAGVNSQIFQSTLDDKSQIPNRRHISAVWRKVGESLEAEAEGTKRLLDNSNVGPMREVWTPDWTRMIHVQVGGLLLDLLKDSAFVQRERKENGRVIATETQPVFYHAYEYVKGLKLGVIKLNPEVAARVAKDSMMIVLPPKHLPMLVTPLKWESPDEGGYLTHKVSAMRFKEGIEGITYMKQAADEGHLRGVFAGLDVLSSTPWTINRSVYEVVLNVWNDGIAIGDIPAADHKSQHVLPEKPTAGSSSPQERAKYIERIKEIHLQMMKDHTERCKFNYNLEIARSYLNDVFYIPHSMDFRGRAYPIPPHLSPVGDDLCRGLLKFGVKKPLGSDGLKWLRIHLSNVYGYDKASFSERERFAIEHEKEIMESADNPLGGSRWWLKGEDPWQCLATCFELTAALRSGDPTTFLSALPVHQDGTCNGMQHYAALGGDSRGAKAVNLDAGDKPADIYTGVADLVNAIVDRDAARGSAVALLAQGKVTRKVVKQTVMTTVYGVTFIGAKNQVAKQLMLKGEIARDDVFATSSYIAKTVLDCIGDLFKGAKDIQLWLTLSARLISRCIPPSRVEHAVKELQPKRASRKIVDQDAPAKPKSRLPLELMTSVIWTTPLGLPVVQPYRKPARKQVMTALQTVYISDPNQMAEISPHKQAMAFPPNFVHSLDATHMLQTALKCSQKDIQFASVHDSYWTHAGTVPQMSEVIRQEFIRLHSKDIIGDLRTEFCQRYDGYLIESKHAMGVLRNRDRIIRKVAAPVESIAGDDDAEVDSAFEGEDDDIASAEMDDNIKEKSALSSKNWRISKGVMFDPEDNAISQVKIGGKSFVNLKDILPVCPKKGDFDVNRTLSSPYFFS